MDSRLLVAVILKLSLIDGGNSQPQDNKWNQPDQVAILASLENKVTYMNSKLEEKLNIVETYFIEMTSKFTEAIRKFSDLENQINKAGTTLDICLAGLQAREGDSRSYSMAGKQDPRLTDKVEGYGKKILRALQTVLDTLNKPQPKSDYQEEFLRSELKKIGDKLEELAVSVNSNIAIRDLSANVQNLLLRAEAQNGDLMGLKDKLLFVGNRLEQVCGPLDGKLQAVWDSIFQLEKLTNLTSVLAASQVEEAVQINKRGEERTAELGDLEAQLLHAMRLGNDLANGLSKEVSVPDSLRNIAYNLSLLLTGLERSATPLLIALVDNHDALSIVLGDLWQAVADKKSFVCHACRNGSVTAKLDFVELQNSLTQKITSLECTAPPAQQAEPAVSVGIWTDIVDQLKVLNDELKEHKGEVTAKLTGLYTGLTHIATSMNSIVSSPPERRPPMKLLENLLG